MSGPDIGNFIRNGGGDAPRGSPVCVIRREILTLRIKRFQTVSAPIGVESARRITSGSDPQAGRRHRTRSVRGAGCLSLLRSIR